MTPKQLATKIAKAADDVQAVDINILDLSSLTSFADFFVICSGKSDTQVKAIADSIMGKLSKAGRKPLGVEGYDQGLWLLVDYGDVVVHIFHNEARNFYNLEKLWGDAPQIAISAGL
ncbi:MAG: ribosome silencing factor [Deltaproteobacteria bacterium]|nr:ribosome silencing factor [Deltaproteobacteria bacterium]